MKNKTPLTDRQQKLLADNIKLVPYTISKAFRAEMPTVKYDKLWNMGTDRAEMPTVTYDKLWDVGTDALIRCVRKWQEEKGKFSTYAVFAIYRDCKLYIQRINNNKKVWSINSFNVNLGQSKALSFEPENRRENIFPSIAAEVVDKLVSKLEPESKKLLECLYGLNGTSKMRKKALAKELNITPLQLKYKQYKLIRELQKIALKDKISPEQQ